ncbi:MAG: MFS transporter [Chthoniobacteraceae bacterium]
MPSTDTASIPHNPPRKVWHVGTLTYTAGGLFILFFWLLWGDFAWAMRDRSVGPVLGLLLKKYGASDLLMGVLMGSLPGAITMILGPIISCKSDVFRSRWGRRIPFLFIPTPVAFLAMIGFAFSPALGHSIHVMLGVYSPGLHPCVLTLLALFWTTFEVSAIIANAVFGGLVNDVVPKEVCGRFYSIFRLVSLFAGIIFSYWMFGAAEENMTAIFLGVGILYGGGFTMMCLNVKEGQYPPPPPDAPSTKGALGKMIGAKTYFVECFGQSYYLWYIVALQAVWMSFVPINLFNLFFAKSLGMDMNDYGKILALTYGVSLVVSYPLGALADRFHPLRVSLVALGFYAAAVLWGGIYATTPRNFAIAATAHGILSGIWITASASIGQRLLPAAKFGQYSSACSFVGAITGMLIPPVVGVFLDATGHAYRYTYFAAFGLAVLGLAAGVVLHRKFMQLGGTAQYAAPE